MVHVGVPVHGRAGQCAVRRERAAGALGGCFRGAFPRAGFLGVGWWGRRGLQGTRRGSPRAPPLARAPNLSVFGTSQPEAESDRWGPPRSRCRFLAPILRGRRVSWFPARRALAPWGIAHPSPEARLSLALAFPVGLRRCVS